VWGCGSGGGEGTRGVSALSIRSEGGGRRGVRGWERVVSAMRRGMRRKG